MQQATSACKATIVLLPGMDATTVHRRPKRVVARCNQAGEYHRYGGYHDPARRYGPRRGTTPQQQGSGGLGVAGTYGLASNVTGPILLCPRYRLVIHWLSLRGKYPAYPSGLW